MTAVVSAAIVAFAILPPDRAAASLAVATFGTAIAGACAQQTNQLKINQLNL